MKKWEEKGGSGGEKKQQQTKEEGKKLRRELAKKRVKAGPSTPVPSWRFQQERCAYDSEEDIIKHHPFSSYSLSARKLAAAFWEQYSQQPPHLAKMHRGINGHPPPPPPPRLRRLNNKDKGVDLPSSYLEDPSPNFPDQPESASSLKRHIAASLMQHHRSMDMNNRALQPVSPASYGSSMEMARYNPAVTPTSSIEFKGRMGDSNYSFKTSTELLKVLNRIWSLEEQHACNVSLIKALKMELNHARAKIKELIQEQQADRQEVDELMKQITEDKLLRKSKEQDRIVSAVQSVREELENERQLRKRSESLHRRLAREIFEVKSSFSSSQKELERERKSRVLLEDLCDEFAKGIKDYEQELRTLRQKSDDDWANRTDPDRMILHISESWLDERTQIKLREAPSGSTEKNSIVDQIRPEIEAFLQAKQIGFSNSPNKCFPRDLKEGRMRRNSSESVPLNDAVSAPQDVGDKDSEDSDSQCFELNKPSNGNSRPHGDETVECPTEDKVKSDHTKKKHVSREKSRDRTPSSFQVKFKEQMAWAMACNGNKAQCADAGQEETKKENPAEISISRKSEIYEAAEDGSYETNTRKKGVHGSNPNYVFDDLIRSHYLLTDGRNAHPEREYGEASHGNTTWRTRASPVRQWMSKLTSTDLDTSESCSKLTPGSKENSLKAKLLEARSKGHRSRLRAPNGVS